MDRAGTVETVRTRHRSASNTRLGLLMIAGAVAAFVAACASSGAVPRPFPRPGGPSAGPATAAPDRPGSTGRETSGDGVVGTALALVGTPYRAGGDGPSGFDCSGLTQWVFARHGVTLPRATKAQFSSGAKVNAGAIQAGDLLFFSTIARGASHVGIALDNDRFVHAPSSRGVVRVERRTSDYWKRRYVGARRIARSEPARSDQRSRSGE
jgi:cell wall-associated NlpC family hydrolase